MTLEQLAKEAGVVRSDGVTPCVKPKNAAATAQHLLLRAVSRATNEQNEGQCVVKPFGKNVSTASFAMYTFSIAVLVQAVVLISFSSVADHGKFGHCCHVLDDMLMILDRNLQEKASLILCLFGFCVEYALHHRLA